MTPFMVLSDLLIGSKYESLCRRKSYLMVVIFFLICRRARRQRSQSPDLGTLEIDKHLELYKLKTKQKTKSSQLASQVMEQSSRFLLTAQSAERKWQTLQSSNSIQASHKFVHANEDSALSCAKLALVGEPSTACHNDNIGGRLAS